MTDAIYRRQMIAELMNILASNLSGLSDSELEGLLRTAGGQGMPSFAAKTLRTPDSSTLVYINPTVNKDSAIKALHDMAGWLEIHWDEYNAAMLAEALRVGLPGGGRSTPDQLN